ncbi:hypothetical protein G7025_10310 [Pseudomonas lurida]|uniref:hypothetical protein n=1 Tax=Pseudomonas lurida TaxID=244566 RepID=UPI0015E48501|nr:hypothetical protein [Pseudomonas lurida]MBA1293751.1 hypothetical protein [Pseudomonas lurida]
MSNISSLLLNQWQENQLPDTYTSATQYLATHKDFIISGTTSGTVVSRYQDDEWNMKMYDAQGRCVYNFVSWLPDSFHPTANTIVGELKEIQFARLYCYPKPRKPSSVGLISSRKLARLALNNNISLRELFNEENLKKVLLQSYAAMPTGQMSEILKLIKELFSIRAKHPDFIFAPNNYEIIERMQSLYNHPNNQRHNSQQTKIIPSRLYAAFITAFNEELDAFNANADAIVELFRLRKNNILFGLSTSRFSSYKNSVSWTYAVAHQGLCAFFEIQSIANWVDLRGYIGEIQCAAKYWIHLFSGMRDNEARLLPADTYKSMKTRDANITILHGYTSKLSGQNHTATFWMTAGIMEKGTIAACHVGTIAAILNEYDQSDLSQYPLFPPLTAGPGGQVQVYEGAPVISTSGNVHSLKRLTARWPKLVVQEEDIRELEQFDGFRDWRNDADVKLGTPWLLASHQCRRSLAVYCARSGLVSIGSLALQFKHLTEVMTSYYRRGNAFAVNFLQSDDAQGWLDELEYERQKVQYIEYEKNVINTSSRLWGGEGNRIQVARDKGHPLIITTDRSATEIKFIKGEMTYKTSPIGGCTNLDHCDKISFTSIFACIDCEKSILDDDRSLKNIKRGLNNLKREQSLFVAKNPLHQQLALEIRAIYEKLEKRGLLEKMEAIL